MPATKPAQKFFTSTNDGYVYEENGKPYVDIRYGNLYYTRRLWTDSDGRQYAELNGYTWYLNEEEMPDEKHQEKSA